MTSINTDYLKELCQKCSKGKVELLPSPLGGLGVFSAVPIAKGDVIFAIPRSLILSSAAPDVLSDPRVAMLLPDPRVTAETLLCAFIGWNKNDPASQHYQYLNSLPPDYTHLVPSELRGTNVGAQLEADAQELATQHQIIQQILPNSKLNLEELMNARVLYNSRRFPFRFAPTGEATVANGGGMEVDRKDISRIAEQSRKRKITQIKQRAVYDPTQGSLCPALDVLNHQSGQEHLQFDISSTTLSAIAKYDIAKGQEIYHNYGCDNNDQCLLQFGFFLESSSSTPVGNDAGGNRNNEYDEGDLDVFAVRVGSHRFDLRESEDIPEVLLEDGGYGLEHHLQSKQMIQANATPSNNPHVRRYMDTQSRLLASLVLKVQHYIEALEDQEEAEEVGEEGVVFSGDGSHTGGGGGGPGQVDDDGSS